MPSATVAACALQLALAGALMAAAALDARHRIYPNALALACTALAGACALARGGPALLGARAALAAGLSGALVLVEIAWRALRGEAGMGMGDVKCLFALVIAAPAQAMGSFTAGLLLMAAAATALRARSLPLLPFVLIPYLALCALAGVPF